MCRKTVIVNSGNFLKWIWPFAKLFMTSETLKKFHFYNDDYLPELLKFTT